MGPRKLILFMGALVAVVPVALWATDGTIAKSGDYTDSATWVGGIIPNGVGATLYAQGFSDDDNADNCSINSMRTNATLGHLDWSSACTNAGTLYMGWCLQAEAVKDGQPLPHYDGYSLYHPYVLTLDSGSTSASSPATIGSTRDRTKTMSVQRYMVDVPIVLKSNLRLQHAGRMKSGKGLYLGGGSGIGTYAGVIVNSDISDGGRKLGIDVKLDTYAYNGSSVATVYNAAMLTGRNTFSGNVTVSEGLLRVDSHDGTYSGVSTALGIGNSVYVQSNLAALDISGVKIGRGQHLYLGSAPVASGSTKVTLGGLCNMRRDPYLTGEWLGQVTLTADSTVGGHLGFGTYRETAGALAISGAIDGNYALRKIGDGYLTLSGENTFTGNLRLEGGYTMLASAASAGNGQIVFAGGGYRMTSSNDLDISTCRLGEGENPVSLFLDGDFSYEPASGFVNQAGLFKMGPGRLVLSKPCTWKGVFTTSVSTERTNYGINVEEGELVIDYTNLGSGEHIFESQTATYEGNKLVSTFVRPANDAKITFRVPAGRRLSLQGMDPFANTCGTIRMEGGGSVYLARLSTYLSLDKAAIVHMDIDEGTVTTYDNNGTHNVTDADLPGILQRGLLWKNESFATVNSSGVVCKFTDFATAWGENCKTQILSVTSALAANVPAHFNVGALYLNTPPASGNVLELKLTGTNIITSGVIFVGPDMGETVVRISGGAIAMNPSAQTNKRFIRLYNFNTNANARLEITSELSCDSFSFDASGNATLSSKNNDGRLLVAGGGTTRFTGKNTIRGNVHILGGRLEINNGDFLDYEADYTNGHLTKNFYLTCGGTLTYLKSGCFARHHPDYATKYDGKWSNPTFHIYRPCGVIDIPDVDQVVGITNTCSEAFHFHNGATLVKTGLGEMLCLNAYAKPDSSTACNNSYYIPCEPVSHWDVREGAVGLPAGDGKNTTRGMSAFGIYPSIVRLRPGVRLVGRGLADANMAYGSGHSSAVDVANPIRYRIDSNPGNPVILDLSRQCSDTVLMGSGGRDLGPRASGLFTGPGNVRAINTTGETTGYLNCNGFVSEDFTGTLILEVVLRGSYGIRIPNGGIHFSSKTPSLVYDTYNCQLTDLIAPSTTLQVGRMTGDGTVNLNLTANEHIYGSQVYLGCDDASTNVFSGRLVFSRTSVRNPELVKIGSNVQEFSGMTENCRSPYYVTEGTFRAGADCLTQSESPIPGKYASVYLGCGAETAGENPRLTTSGPYTIVAPIYAWPDGDTDPEIGTDALTGTSVYKTGEISIQNRVAFTAAGASTVIVSNNLVGTGVLSKRGTGTVILAGTREETLTLGDIEAGSLTVTGDVIIEEGSVLDLSMLDYSGRVSRYELLSSDGTISGFENYTIVGKPTNWTVQNWNGRYVLVRRTGMQILFWGRAKN